MRELTPLCLLARKYETDKGGRHLRYGGGDSDTTHEYTPVYYDLLHKRTNDVRRVFEIGINSGASLRMWREFFPNAIIYGVDSNGAALFQEDRIRTEPADQNNAQELYRAVRKFWLRDGSLSFDLIVDDGSHILEHQIVSMRALVPHLSPDGIYVVEDLAKDCQPELVGNHVPDGFVWEAIPTERGLGKAYQCGCGQCSSPEQLLVIRRG